MCVLLLSLNDHERQQHEQHQQHMANRMVPGNSSADEFGDAGFGDKVRQLSVL